MHKVLQPGGRLSKSKVVCPLGYRSCKGKACKYYDPMTGRCKLLARKFDECLTC